MSVVDDVAERGVNFSKHFLTSSRNKDKTIYKLSSKIGGKCKIF